MMQATQSRHGNDFAIRPCIPFRLAPGRRLLPQPEVSTVLVIVVDVIAHETLQMALVEHDDMVEQIAAAGANPAVGHAILPRAPNRSADRAYAQILNGLQNLTMERVLAIKD